MGLALCIVGCGRFARKFVKEVRSFKGFATGEQIEFYFTSRDRKRARAYCSMLDGRDYFGSYEEAAADPRVEALYFCTPHHLHMEHALIATRLSKHVLVEKPIARTVEEGERMVSAAKEAGVRLMVAENYRYMPLIQKARNLINQGMLGTLRFIQIQEESNLVVEGWRTESESMGGGVFIDGGIHSVAILRDLVGPPADVYASILPRTLSDMEGEDGGRRRNGGYGEAEKWSDRPYQPLLGYFEKLRETLGSHLRQQR